jgi:4-amino-4-deoxy-L-arabinose transferase-like glycosyltransferase
VRRTWSPRSILLLALVTAAPRLAVLLYERGTITSQNVDKGSVLAKTFLDSGTYGFFPGHPSAYTQPLYGFFLVPVYELFGRGWVAVGLAQLAVAIVTTLVVYAIARRFVSDRAALLCAAFTTLQPYLVWHDMHMNREILDELVAAAVVLLTLRVAETAGTRAALLLGLALGAAILGNARLLLLPAIVVVWLGWRLRRRVAVPALVAVAGLAVVVTPWGARNKAEVGCFTVTTDTRALWKANNPLTYGLLTHGRWIDNTPDLPGQPPSPQDVWRYIHHYVPTDECAQMSFYRHRALTWIEHHPGEKAKLAALGASWLWQPSVTKTEDRPSQGGGLDRARTWLEAAYAIPVYLLAAFGVFLVARPFAVLTVAVLAYNTLLAAAFAGETRYRVPWDFLLVVLAARAATALVGLVRSATMRRTEAGAV